MCTTLCQPFTLNTQKTSFTWPGEWTAPEYKKPTMPAAVSDSPITSAYLWAGVRMIRIGGGREGGLGVYSEARCPALHALDLDEGHTTPRRRGAHAARPPGQPAGVRDGLRPARGRGLLARVPDGRQPCGGGGRGAGGLPVDMAQPPPLRERPRQRPLLGPRHRAPPDHRRA